MSSYQGNTTTNLSSKKDNKFVRSVKPPKTGQSSRRTKTEDENVGRITAGERGTKSGNREKGNYKDKNLTSESSATSTSGMVSNNNINESNSIKISNNEAIKIKSGGSTKSENQNDKDKNTESSEVSTTPVVVGNNIKHSNITTNSFEPSSQAVRLKKDENSKGTALSKKATRFDAHSGKRSLLTGKKISVKQLDVNKVYLQ